MNEQEIDEWGEVVRLARMEVPELVTGKESTATEVTAANMVRHAWQKKFDAILAADAVIKRVEDVEGMAYVIGKESTGYRSIGTEQALAVSRAVRAYIRGGNK